MKIVKRKKKSVSSAIKQIMQKNGDKLVNGSMSREELVAEASKLSDMARADANRSWGDQSKDAPKGKK